MKWHTDFTQKTFPAVHQWFLTTLVLNVCSLGAKKTGATNTPPPLRNEYLILEFCGDGQSVFLLFLLLFDRRGRGVNGSFRFQRRACVLCRDGRFGGKSCKGGAGRPLCSSPGAAGPVTVAGRPVSLGPFCGLRPRPHLPAGVPAQGGHAAAGLACAPHCWESLVLCPCPSNAHCLEAAGRGLVLQPLCSCFCAFFPT